MNALRKASLAGLAVAILLSIEPAARALWVWTHPNLLRVDYTLYVLASLQGLHQGWDHLWDLEAQRRAFTEIPGAWWFPNVYTPALSLFMVPFTALPLGAGYALWSLLMLASLLLSWRLLCPGGARLRLALLPLLFATMPVWLGLVMGQILVLQMGALAVSVTLLRRGRERAAGAVLAVIALKPQALFLVPFALLAAGRRRLFVSWAACMAAIGAAMLALVKPSGASAYLARLQYAQSHLAEFWVSWSFSMARHFPQAPAFRLVQLATFGMMLLIAHRHRARPEIAVAAGLVASLIAAPFVHPDDYMFLFPAAWLVMTVEDHPLLHLGLLGGYAAMLISAVDAVGGRWVLLFIALFLPALLLLRRRESVSTEAAPSAARLAGT